MGFNLYLDKLKAIQKEDWHFKVNFTNSFSVHLIHLCSPFFPYPLLAKYENLFGQILSFITELSFIIIYSETV